MIFRSIFLLALLNASLLVQAQSDNLTHAFAEQRAAQVGDVTYDLHYDLHAGQTTYRGSVGIELTLKLGGDLHVDFNGKAIEHVRVQAKDVPAFTYSAEQGQLIIPAASLTQGAQRIDIDFVGNFTNTGQGFHRFVDPVDGLEYLYTHLEPNDAHRVFPCFDQPDLRAEYLLEVTAPSDWTLVANGAVASRLRDGERTRTRFKRTRNFSTYISHLSAGPYASFHDSSFRYPLGLYCRQSIAKFLDVEHLFETTRKSFDFYETYFDTPYAYEKYDQIFCPEYNIGAMENVAAVTWNDDRAIFRHTPTADEVLGRDNTLFHEMAHMWFGDLVTMKWWNDLWLKESFATYMSYLAFEGLGVPDVWTRSSGSKDWALSSDQRINTHPILATITDVRAAASNFDGITYGKGFAVLRQLDNYLGGTVFRDGCRIYFKNHAFEAVTLKEFMAAMEQAAGRSLANWTEQWLGQKGVNTLKLSYTETNGRISAAKIEQLPSRFNDVLRDHTTHLGLYATDAQGKLVEKQRIKVTYSGASTALPQLEGLEAPALIVPNISDIDFVKVIFDQHSLTWLLSNIGKLEEPELKSATWRILYDMLQDGNFSAHDYYEMAFAQIPHETHPSLLDRLLNQLANICDNYIPDPAVADQYRARLCDLTWAEMQRRGPGDAQISLFSHLHQNATTPKQFAYLEELIQGRATIPGLDMTNGRKWQMILNYAHFSHRRADGFAKELAAKDKSVQARNAQLTLSAMSPEPEHRAELWRQITEDQHLSLPEVSAIASGILPDRQPAVAKQMIKPFFDVLPQLYRDREYAWVNRFARILFPRDGGEEAVIAAHKFLDSNQLDPTLHLMIAGYLDDLERRLSVRKTWATAAM